MNTQELKRLIIDGASVAWTALYAGNDEEFGKKVEYNGKMVQVNSAEHGYENALNMISAAWKRFDIAPIDTIFIREGKDTKLFRQKIMPEYKGGRTESHAPEQYVQYDRLIEMLIEDLRSIGASAVTQDGVEGDDVIAYLTRNLRGERYILSGDGDMAALVAPGVHLWRREELDKNPYGDFEFRAITTYKALVGDTTDKIKGAPGFAEKSFLDLYCVFGDDGLELMEDLIRKQELHKLEEDVPSLKTLKKIIDGADSVYKSFAVARMWPERVNTLDCPLQWALGYVKTKSEVRADERIRAWAASHRLVHAHNFKQAMDFFKEKLAESPTVTLDLETSVGEQSIDWLEARTAKGGGVDVIGSEITGCGLTFGKNNQFSFYVAVDHLKDFAVPNVKLEQLGEMLKLIPKDKITLAHNAAGFELPVLANAFREAWADNGWRGFFPNMVDTRIAASYWNENLFSHGLKQLSKALLGYDQISYESVTTIDGVQHTMRELTAEHVFAYGIDDVVMTSAIWNFFRTQMELENTLRPFFELEQKPMYLSALSYVEGTKVDMERLALLRDNDAKAYSEHSYVLDGYLLEKGWEGTVCPKLSADTLDAATVKMAFELLVGRPLDTRVRTVSKLIALIDAEDGEEPKLLAALLTDENYEALNLWIQRRFDNTPTFEESSPKQMQKLLYEVMAMPVRMRNPATDTMRAKGITEGTAKTDDDAMKMALSMGDCDRPEVLKALMEMRSINTRRGLYWEPYPKAVHWKTGRIHPELKQSSTNTRRWASSNPNIQQLDSGEGSVRTVILPHHPKAVVVSLDESGQEVRLAAAYSQDPNLLTCYLGSEDQLRDVHSIVACKIAGIPYAEFRSRLKGVDKAVAVIASKIRGMAKTVLFASFYGAGAKKIALGLSITEAEAQGYIDTIYGQFPELAAWKTKTEKHAAQKGWVPVWAGDGMYTRRHLREQLLGGNAYEQGKALRQASNASIQSGGANQIKSVMAKVWDSDMLERYDMRWMFPVHDECVFSVMARDAGPAIEEAHGFMVAPFLAGGVPSASSIGIGPNFGDLIEIGEKFSREAVADALDQIFNPEMETA